MGHLLKFLPRVLSIKYLSFNYNNLIIILIIYVCNYLVIYFIYLVMMCMLPMCLHVNQKSDYDIMIVI